jgi:choline dehydrogenase-like flavoprotein
MGCEGWSYEDVLPYFRKAEDNDSFEDRYHGKGGPLGVSQPRAPLPICEAYFAAAAEIGIPRNSDLTGESQDGVGYYQLTQRDARRSSAAVAYLGPARARPNLTVRTGVQVRRITVDKGRATGVELTDGTRIEAGTEVILSSGAIGSPWLLQLSGLGPADHLREVGLTPILDRAGVGSNLQDHLDLFVICEVTGPHTYDRYAKLHWSALAGLQYLLTKTGPVASSLFETGDSGTPTRTPARPTSSSTWAWARGSRPGWRRCRTGGDAQLRLSAAPLPGDGAAGLKRPGAGAANRPQLLGDPHDREMSIRGLKLAQEIMRQAPLKPFVLAERLPGPEVRTEQDYVDYASRNAKTDHHPAGTCRMGADPEAVTDPRLRLNGIEGLRVADASIMPTVVSSNTNWRVIANWPALFNESQRLLQRWMLARADWLLLAEGEQQLP